MRNFRLILFSAGTLLFGWLFYTRFWKWRDCIAEAASSCVTPDGDNVIGAGALWIIPAGICLLFALLALLRKKR